MVYGHYITETSGNKRFFAEGCSYCRMSAGGQHEPNCPCKDMKVVGQVRTPRHDDEGNFEAIFVWR